MLLHPVDDFTTLPSFVQILFPSASPPCLTMFYLLSRWHPLGNVTRRPSVHSGSLQSISSALHCGWGLNQKTSTDPLPPFIQTLKYVRLLTITWMSLSHWSRCPAAAAAELTQLQRAYGAIYSSRIQWRSRLSSLLATAKVLNNTRVIPRRSLKYDTHLISIWEPLRAVSIRHSALSAGMSAVILLIQSWGSLCKRDTYVIEFLPC